MTESRPTRSVLSREWFLYAITTVLTSVLAFLSLELWRAKLSVPLTYSGDALPTAAHFKTVIQEGWYEYQPRLGAPWGQTYNDFPTADNLHMVFAKIFGLFSSDWAAALNVYFFLGFVLIALASVWFLRVCGVSRVFSVVLSVVFALAPYHFIRGESHLWLASYYGVPLGLGLLVLIYKRKALWGKGPQTSAILAWLFGPTARTVVFLAILGSSSSYYSVFFLILLAAMGIAVFVRDREWRPFWGAVLAGGVIVVVMLSNMLPDIIFRWVNGPNFLGLERSRAETEYFALKFTQLILPWSGHRNDTLRGVREQYDSGFLALGEQPALGFIAAVGFVSAFLWIGVVLIKRSIASSPKSLDERWNLLSALSLLILVAFMFSTIGGVSTLISFVTSSLRGWNRMSIVIMALSLAVVGLLLDLLLDRLKQKVSARSTRRAVAVVVGVALLAIAFYDQTPRDASAHYDENAARFAADAEWIASIEDQLAPGAMVTLLPYIPFPESSSANGFLASDQLVPYLHSTNLQWSNGAIKGRPRADWPGQLDDYAARDLAQLIATADFTGLMIMRSAYADGGAAVENAVTASTGITPRTSEDGRYSFFDLQELSDSIHEEIEPSELTSLAYKITNPVTPYPYPGFTAAFDSADHTPFFGGSGDGAALTLVNDSTTSRTVHVSFEVVSGVPQGVATLLLPDGSVLTAEHDDHVAVFSTDLVVPPGSSLLQVTLADAAGGPVAESIVRELRVQEREIAAYLRVGDR